VPDPVLAPLFDGLSLVAVPPLAAGLPEAAPPVAAPVLLLDEVAVWVWLVDADESPVLDAVAAPDSASCFAERSLLFFAVVFAVPVAGSLRLGEVVIPPVLVAAPIPAAERGAVVEAERVAPDVGFAVEVPELVLPWVPLVVCVAPTSPEVALVAITEVVSAFAELLALELWEILAEPPATLALPPLAVVFAPTVATVNPATITNTNKNAIVFLKFIYITPHYFLIAKAFRLNHIILSFLYTFEWYSIFSFATSFLLSIWDSFWFFKDMLQIRYVSLHVYLLHFFITYFIHLRLEVYQTPN
jgi:hypothetical protein